MNFFQSLGVSVANFFDFLDNSNIQNILQALGGLIGLTVSIWVIMEAYKSFAGKSQSPIVELVWKIASTMLLLAVAFNNGGFLDLLKTAFTQLHHMMSGDVSLYAQLDKLFDEATKLSYACHEASAGSYANIGGYITGTLAQVFIFIGLFAVTIPSFGIIAISELTLKLLLLLLPLAIFSLIFKFSKDIFNQWLNLFISNALTILIVGLTLTSIMGGYIQWQSNLMNDIAKQNADVLAIAMQSLFMGFIGFGIVFVAKEIAEKLGTVSIEALGSSALGGGIAGGIAGAGVNAGLSALKNKTGIGAAGTSFSSAKNALNQSSNAQKAGGTSFNSAKSTLNSTINPPKKG